MSKQIPLVCSNTLSGQLAPEANPFDSVTFAPIPQPTDAAILALIVKQLESKWSAHTNGC